MKPAAAHLRAEDEAPPQTGVVSFVAVSELSVPESRRAASIAASGRRLGAVDTWAAAFLMVSWWDSEESFTVYMRSDDHRRSHARIPAGPDRARPRKFHRYQVVVE